MNADGQGQELRESADIAFTATVKAEELCFDEVPQTRVEFTGNPSHESYSGSVRINLPDRVRKGVTYRHIQVDYVLASKLAVPADPVRTQLRP